MVTVIGVPACLATPIFVNQRRTTVDAAIASGPRGAPTAKERYITGTQAGDAVTHRNLRLSKGNLLEVAIDRGWAPHAGCEPER